VNEGWERYAAGKLGFQLLLTGMICAENSPLKRIEKKLKDIAPKNKPVLITGETGSGKDLLAKAVHNLSGRAGGLHTFNCAEFEAADSSLPLIKLYGCGPGHGLHGMPKMGQSGVLAEAGEGTVFLNEIADLPLPIQTSLLSIFDGEPFRPHAGRGKPTLCRARFVGATNKDIPTLIDALLFREDFYRRFPRPCRFEIPPLRTRPEDIGALTAFYSNSQVKPIRLPEDLFKALFWYPWPFNVAELRDFFEAVGGIAQLKTAKSALNASWLDECVGPEMAKGLRKAYLKYQTAAGQVSVGNPERKIVEEIVEVSRRMFDRSWSSVDVPGSLEQFSIIRDSQLEIMNLLSAKGYVWDKARAREEYMAFLKDAGYDSDPSENFAAGVFQILQQCYPGKTEVGSMQEGPADERRIDALDRGDTEQDEKIGNQGKSYANVAINLLMAVFKNLRAGPSRLSSTREARIHETFERFFGIKYDAVRKRVDKLG
jgi:transcriptional regulator with AAA-type ATPase domain